MWLDVAGAESAGRQMAGGAEAYGAAVERLSHGFAVSGRWARTESWYRR
ncbi:hypothetical protein GCM10010412_097690 [Nonomuraea recticatena]|uniref:Uncharacterized protein n=1 Tax=Nonomuraea recticatena TaxID=46178 RepID=A0ABN3TGN6_9ACTN